MERKVFYIVTVALLALAGIVLARNDLIVGSLRPTSVLLYQQTHNVSGIPGQIVSQNVVFINQVRNISRIRAIDLNVNGTGGFADIISGGVGFRNVTLRLRASAAGRGYNFLVDIYGH